MTDITQDINYPKVVWEQLRRWRIVRKPLLEMLDIEFMRALETDDAEQKALVAARKQALRDITTYDFSGATTLQEIYTIWPEVLGSVPDEFKVD